MKYLCLLRGVNVGGKNTVSMADLKTHLQASGFENVSSYINSGNILLESDLSAPNVARHVEQVIVKNFKLDSELIKVRALTADELAAIIQEAPKGFGAQPDTYHSDIAFMLDEPPADLLKVTSPQPEVDKVWEGKSVVYFQRVSALRTKSRMSRIASAPIYKSITIRSWSTTIKLLALLTQA